jgi:hypothetical protein
VTLVADPTERERVATLAQAALDRHQPKAYALRVARDSVLQEDDWYRVVVTTPDDVRTYEFYDALAEAEADLQDEQGLNILLVPVAGE